MLATEHPLLRGRRTEKVRAEVKDVAERRRRGAKYREHLHQEDRHKEYILLEHQLKRGEAVEGEEEEEEEGIGVVVRRKAEEPVHRRIREDRRVSMLAFRFF